MSKKTEKLSEVGYKLLDRITESADNSYSGEELKALADAYATVAGTMPSESKGFNG